MAQEKAHRFMRYLFMDRIMLVVKVESEAIFVRELYYKETSKHRISANIKVLNLAIMIE